MSDQPILYETVYREWRVDLRRIRDDFADDGVESDEDVIEAAWENGAREPYFIPFDLPDTDVAIWLPPKETAP